MKRTAEALERQLPIEERARRQSGIAPSRSRVEGIEPASLRYVLQTPRGDGRDLDLAYATWRRVWTEALAELDGADRVFSDDFTRQDELGVLFHEDACVGMTAFRFVDFSVKQVQEDSYFAPWPASARTALLGVGRRVCIGSYLTVDAAWRGARGPLRAKELLLTLAVERFLASYADVMAGTLRNNRGMNDLAYRLGARALAVDVQHHGVAVDLVAFHRDARDRFELTPFIEEVTGALVARALQEKADTTEKTEKT